MHSYSTLEMSLKKLAADQFINGLEDSNNFFKAESLIKDTEKAEMAVKTLMELELLEMVCWNNVRFYKIKIKRNETETEKESQDVSSQFTVDTEMLKYKRNQLPAYESLLRQVKLLQSIRSSGEEDKLIELIDKWENVTRDVIKELFNQQAAGGSLKKFVKKLGLKYEELGFEDEDEESEEVEGSEAENYYNFNEDDENTSYNIDKDFKRIKYDD